MTRGSLSGRLLAAFLVVIAAALGTVGVAVLLTGPHYFAEAMGHLPGDRMGQQMASDTQSAFSEAMVRALAAGGVIAIVTATVVSFLVAARIARPVSRLAVAAHRIAGGHYAERVETDAPGELGDLGATFNDMAAALEATERRRLQLVGDVAHELRTPLATLDGYLEGLEDGVIAPTPKTWRLLRAESTRMTRMVNELSELWRAEAHQLTLRTERLDIAQVAREVADRFAPSAQTRRISIERPDAPAWAVADRDRVSQIVLNYLSNALRHAPDDSVIRIEAAATPDHARLSVIDEGSGLAPDQLETVFERFYRVDAARSRSAGGSGIGLAIVRALADAMGGSAWAESRGLGLGSTFHLELPAA